MVNIDASEVTQLSVDLAREPATKIRRVQRAIRKTASDVERDGKILAPVDTGNLENSISTSVEHGGLAAEIGPTANYGHYVEFGTSRMSPQPYMRPAFDRNTPGLVFALEKIAGDIL